MDLEKIFNQVKEQKVECEELLNDIRSHDIALLLAILCERMSELERSIEKLHRSLK